MSPRRDWALWGVVALLLWAGRVQADITSNLVAYWACDEGGSGTSLTDSTGNGHTGTLVAGTARSSPGKIGAGALLLNGTSDRFTFTTIASGTSYTVALWLLPTTTPETFQNVMGDTGGSIGWYMNGSTLRLNFYNGTDHLSTGTVPVNAWIHLAITNAAGTLTFYKNGVADASTYTSIGAVNFTTMGGRSGSDFYEGNADDIRLYSRALSVGDINELVALGSATPRKRTMGY